MIEKLDLFTAKEKAKQLSVKNSKRKVYVLADDAEGDCSFSFNPNIPGQTALHCYVNGSEIAIENVKEKSEPVNVKQKPMATKTKDAKKTSKPAASGIGKATTVILSKEQWSKFEKALESEGSNIRTAVVEALKAKYKL